MMCRFLCAVSVLICPAAILGAEPSAWQGKGVEQWVAQLAPERSIADRWCAAYALGQIGPGASEAVEPLATILTDRQGHEYVRCCAAWALGCIAREKSNDAAARALTETLSSERESIRRQSARALGNLGAAARSAVPKLLGRLRDARETDATVRANVAVALWKIDRSTQAIDALAQMVRQGAGAAPYQAAVALGEIGAATPDGAEKQAVVSALAAALRHADPNVGRAAARSLGQIGAAAMPALKEAAADPDAEVRRRAVEALGWMAEPAVPALIEHLKNQSPPARRAAALALGRLGPAAKTAEAPLVETLGDADPEVRKSAAWALGRIRRAARAEGN